MTRDFVRYLFPTVVGAVLGAVAQGADAQNFLVFISAFAPGEEGAIHSYQLSAQEPALPGHESAQTYSPSIAPASNEGLLAMKRMQVPAGLKLELVAAEPMLANPVSFSIDERGRFYVAETFRINAGVTDNRYHMYWLDDDLACRTVEDR